LFNTATGAQTLDGNTTGSDNTANGFQALSSNTTGYDNTAIGYGTLFSNTTGHHNTALGSAAGLNVTFADNVICIGANVSGDNVSNSCYIGSIFGQLSSGGAAVFVNATGKLGTTTSSRRFKDEIKPMDQASQAILALKPVTFRYKKEIDPHAIPQFGLVAEDVEKVNPDLVVRDAEGKVNTVRYDAVNAMLLNEFLKEHKKVVEQEATIAQQDRNIQEQKTTITQLERQMETVVAHLEQQDSKIRRVSDQIEVSKFATGRIRRGRPAPTVVVNTP
jgi:hypothetical protein